MEEVRVAPSRPVRAMWSFEGVMDLSLEETPERAEEPEQRKPEEMLRAPLRGPEATCMEALVETMAGMAARSAVAAVHPVW